MSAARFPLLDAPLGVTASPAIGAGAARRAWRPTALLTILCIALPLLLLGAGAQQSWQAARREAEAELAGTAEAAAEFTSRVLAAHAVGAGRLNEILRDLPDAAIRAREAELHLALRAAVAEIPHASAAFVLDRSGTPLVAADLHPVPRWAVASDREFFRALQAAEAPAVHVSPVIVSRITGERFFTVSRRRAGGDAGAAAGADGTTAAPPGTAGTAPADAGFSGIVAIAVYPEALGPDLSRMRRGPADFLGLLRQDGQLLVGTGQVRSAAALAADSPFQALDAPPAGMGGADPLRGEPMLVATRAVPGFPVRVAVTRPRGAVLAAWWERLLPQIAIGVPAMLALGALAFAVRRGQHRLEQANALLEQRVAERTAALSDLSEALDLTPAMVLDLEGRIRHWSTGCERYYGYTAAEAEGRRASALLRTEWPGGSDAVLREGLRRHGEWRGEVRQRRRDGSAVITAAHWILRRDPHTGTPTGLVTTRADLTAQRSAEEALLATERRLRQAQEASGVIPFGIEADGALHGSESLRALFGWDVALPLDRATLLMRVVPEDRGGLDAAFARLAREGGVFALEFRIQPPGRGPRWVHLRGEAEADPAGSGRPRALLGVALDITDRRLAERALAESEERLRLAREAAGLGIFDYDIATRRIAWDARLCALWGMPVGLAATPRRFLAALHPEDAPACRAALRRAFRRDGDGTLRAEYRVIGIADGVERWVAASGRIRRDPATGRAVRLVGAAFDVTARKQAELRNELLMREVDHRAKNALAVVQAALRLSRAETPADLVRMVEGRVSALARAQTVLAQRQWQGAELHLLLEGELAPFLPRDAGAAAQAPRSAEAARAPRSAEAARAPRVRLDGPPVTIGAYAAQPISMALHELATNATKYGALSRSGGVVAVRWRLIEAGTWLCLEWCESGGPPVPGPPVGRGFGSRVIEQTITQQLGGRIERRWAPEGLACVLEIPLRRGPEIIAARAA